MGIDIYLRWDDQTEDEKQAQYTGFSSVAGNVGYLREAYHGGPYATRYLVSEAFESDSGNADIPASILRERLPATVMIATYRNHIVYGEGQSPGEIALEGEAGVNAVIGSLAGIFAGIETMKAGTDEKTIAERLTFAQKHAAAELIGSRQLPDYALSFVEFVELAEKKETETGKPCTVGASY